MTEKYYAKLKTNNLLPSTYYLNKDLGTNEFLLTTKEETDDYQTLFTLSELESLLGQDINSYELIIPDDYDEDGYDRSGYDRYGYDRSGYDRNGYDRVGYDKDCYDKNGYDLHGYDKDGYNKDGYDKYGYDKDGYDKDGCNVYDLD